MAGNPTTTEYDKVKNRGIAYDAKVAIFDAYSEEDGWSVPDDLGEVFDSAYAAGEVSVISSGEVMISLSSVSTRSQSSNMGSGD